jgi:ATP-dependent DNA helicase RecQ
MQTHEQFKQHLMHRLLSEQFGFSDFRPGQSELISAILDGRDVLGVLPTGAGKSLCYELPALMLPGLTVVVTPLISLMQDQVRRLTQTGIPAAFVNSTLTYEQERDVLDATLRAQNRILYVAPERLETPAFLAFAKKVPITILAVDEAHCVSQWGQDFRPAYLRIPDFVDQLPKRPVIAAFTATATPRTRDDIAARLRLRHPLVTTTTFDRPNLTWQVLQPASRRERTDWILDWALSHKGEPGIVYCSTRKAVDDLADRLEDAGVSARPYHAGHSGEERERNQADFLSGKVSVIVATNAFGMGIDKPDVRWVLHNNAPQNLEEYYQEAGRAGRDGKPSDCVLLWMEGDFHTSRRFIDEAGRGNDELDEADRQAVRRHLSDLLEAMHSYCLTTGCLRNAILDYFGEHKSEPCGRCTNCRLAASGQQAGRDVTVEARGILAVVGEMGERLPYALGRSKVISIALGQSGPELEKVMPDDWDSFGLLADTPLARSSSTTAYARVLRQVVDQLLASGILASGRYSSLEPGPRFSEAQSSDFTLSIRRHRSVRLSRSLSGGGFGSSSHSGLRARRSAVPAVVGGAVGSGDSGDTVIDPSTGEILNRSSMDTDQATVVTSGQAPVTDQIADQDAEALFQQLRRVRLRLAKKEGVPAFRIATNKTLKNIVIARPADIDALLEVNGVGPATAEKYGKAFIDALKEE